MRRYKNLAKQLVQSTLPTQRENQAQWEQAVWCMSTHISAILNRTY